MKRWFALAIKKNCYISLTPVAKLKNYVVFALTYVLESFARLYGDFCMNSFSVDSDEELNAS